MRYKFVIVDVFSANPFGGNQLAVLPQAAGITAEGMQAIAREFNFSETTFVLPATDAMHTCQVRIFTPKAELPFAGHPTIGTACVLVKGKYVGSGGDQDLVVVEGIGPVHVRVTNEQAAIRAKLTVHVKPEQPPFTLRKKGHRRRPFAAQLGHCGGVFRKRRGAGVLRSRPQSRDGG